jgi:hypothetical protein
MTLFCSRMALRLKAVQEIEKLRAQLVLKGSATPFLQQALFILFFYHRLADLSWRGIGFRSPWFVFFSSSPSFKLKISSKISLAVALEQVKPPTPQQQDCIRQIILAGFGDHVARYIYVECLAAMYPFVCLFA